MIELREYVDDSGDSPFKKWFDSLNSIAAAKVTVALSRIEQGNFSNSKSVGSGVLEFRLDFGPGYRIYFGKEGERLVILVGGGAKKRQRHDVLLAHERWAAYKLRKKLETN